MACECMHLQRTHTTGQNKTVVPVHTPWSIIQYVSGLMDFNSKHDTYDGPSSIISILKCSCCLLLCWPDFDFIRFWTLLVCVLYLLYMAIEFDWMCSLCRRRFTHNVCAECGACLDTEGHIAVVFSFIVLHIIGYVDFSVPCSRRNCGTE